MSNRFLNVLFVILIVLMTCQASAQTWYRVDSVHGQQTVAFNTVTIDSSGATGYWGPYCAWNLNYRIGAIVPFSDTGRYKFSFSIPVRAVRFRTAVSNSSEKLIFYINGVHYNIVAPILDSFPTGCLTYSTRPIGAISNGDIVYPGVSNLFEQVIYIEPGYPINTAQIIQTGGANGTIFDFNFSYDYSYIAIRQPFNDTALCKGDSLLLPYNALAMFNSGNAFIAQLSNASGSFANPIDIGSITSFASDTIRCKIPLNTPVGTGYRLRIVSTDRKDTSATNGINIKISDFPVPVATSNSPVCEGATLTMSASSITPVDSFTWEKTGQPNINAQSISFPNVPLSFAGDYIVDAAYNSCKGKDTITVIIKPRPAMPVVITNSPVCPGDTLFLSANGIAGGSYEWAGPNGFHSSVQNTFITGFNNIKEGYYYARVFYNDCFSLPTVEHVVQGEVPKLVVTNNGPVCSGEPLILIATDTTSIPVAGLSYKWQGPGGYSDTSRISTIPAAKTNQSGTYIVTAIKNNCSDTDTTFVTVLQMPPKPKLSSNSPVCEGKELQLFAIDSMAGLSYNWAGPQGFNIASRDLVISNPDVNASGVYTATVNNNICSSADTISVLVRPVIIPKVSSNSPVDIGKTIELYITDTMAGVNYSWSGPNGFMSTLLTPVIIDATEKNSGTYIVTTVLDGCAGSGITIVQVIETDTGAFDLYPSPNNGNFKLKGLVAKDQSIHLAIYNTAGQLLYNRSAATHNCIVDENLSLPSAANGVYHLHLRADGKNIDIPFVIKQ
jgi:hypothetical protein